jgi:hypothetical protein
MPSMNDATMASALMGCQVGVSVSMSTVSS